MTQRRISFIPNRRAAIAACAVVVLITACEGQLPTSGETEQGPASMQQSVAGRDAQTVYIDSMRVLEEAALRVGDAVPVRERVASLVDSQSFSQIAPGSINVLATRPPTVAIPGGDGRKTVAELNARRHRR